MHAGEHALGGPRAGGGRLLLKDGQCDEERTSRERSQLKYGDLLGYIYEVCDNISNKMSYIRFGTYVDDMTLAREGTHEMVVGGLAEATEFCVKELRNIKLKC